MAKTGTIFKNTKRPVRRKHIGWGEVLASLIICSSLALIAIWFIRQKDAYDPGERDIATEVLTAQAVEDTLYRSPLKLWSDPSQSLTSANQVPDLGLFPTTILADGWIPSSRVQTFSPETLYEKINGAAEQFLQFGFAQLDYVSLKQSASELELSIELYDMGRFENALGIFVAQRDASRKTERVGQAHYYQTSIGAMAMAGKYYLKISGTEAGETAQSKARAVLESITETLSTEIDAPKSFSLLTEALEIPFNALAYERSDVFQYDFAKDFWFASPSPDSEWRYFLHEEEEEAAAQALYDKLLKNNLYDYTLVEQQENEVQLRHQFLENYMGLNRQGLMIFGVEGAASPEELTAALKPLREALSYAEEM